MLIIALIATKARKEVCWLHEILYTDHIFTRKGKLLITTPTVTVKTLFSYDMLTVCSVTSVVIRWNVEFSLFLFMSETWAVYHQLFVLFYFLIYFFTDLKSWANVCSLLKHRTHQAITKKGPSRSKAQRMESLYKISLILLLPLQCEIKF